MMQTVRKSRSQKVNGYFRAVRALDAAHVLDPVDQIRARRGDGTAQCVGGVAGPARPQFQGACACRDNSERRQCDPKLLAAHVLALHSHATLA